MKKSIDVHYTNPRLVAIYDLENPWSKDTDYYLSLAMGDKMKILDLGCGTGILTCAFAAKGHLVTGVDPSQQMLKQARKKHHADKVNWICSRAENFHSNQKFDLITMTGHVFQVFITDDEIHNVLKIIRSHISSEGIVAFESLNPRLELWENWKSHTFKNLFDGKEAVKCWKEIISIENGIVKFSNVYQFSDTTLMSHSALRFLSYIDLKKRVEQEGFNILESYGDWSRAPFTVKSRF